MLAGILTFGLLVCLAGVIYPFRPFCRRWRALAAGFALFLLLGYVASDEGIEQAGDASSPVETPLAEAVAANPSDCPIGATVSGATFRVRGSGINIRKGPGSTHERVVNGKATGIFGETQYATIDSSTVLMEECRQGEWSRIHVSEPEWLRETYRGWVANRYLISEAEFVETGFTEADIYFDNQTEPHRAMIVRAVNKIAKEDPRCRESIDPGSVALSPSRSEDGKPVFFVTCGTGMDVVNVYFNEADLAANRVFRAPTHIDRSRAIDLCEAHAKQAASHPSTVDFSRFLDLGVSEHANGRTTVVSSFSARNAFNLELTYNIRCLLDASGLIEASIVERQ